MSQRKGLFSLFKTPEAISSKQHQSYIFLNTVKMEQRENFKCFKIQSAGDKCFIYAKSLVTGGIMPGDWGWGGGSQTPEAVAQL